MLMLHATRRPIAIDTVLILRKGKTTSGLRGPLFHQSKCWIEGVIQDKHKWLRVGVSRL